MRYVLGVMDDQLSGDFDFGAVAWTGWLVGRINELRFCLKTGLDDLVGDWLLRTHCRRAL